MLLIGPANEVTSSSLYLFLKLRGFIWTGLPHQNWMRKIIIKPIRETWRNGFNVSLHSILGVSSPNLFAVYAWANSWTAMDMMKMIPNSTYGRNVVNIIYSQINTTRIMFSSWFSIDSDYLCIWKRYFKIQLLKKAFRYTLKKYIYLSEKYVILFLYYSVL